MKKLLALMTVLLCVGLVSGSAYADWRYEFTEDTNTLGLWHFNETSGDTAYNEVSEGNDAVVHVPYRGWRNEYAADTYTIGLWHFNETSGDTAYNEVSGSDGALYISYKEWRRKLSIDNYTIGLWHFDEGSGDTAYNEVSGSDGILVDCEWDTGKFGSAVDMSGQNNDYVAFENYDTICQTSGSTTWEFWMKPDEVDTDIGWGAPVHAYGKVQFLYQQDPAGGIVQFMIFDWSKVPTDYYKSINGTTRLTPGEWTHVAGTWNDTDSTMKLYINGVLDASDTFSDYYCWTYNFWSGSAREAPGTYNFSGLVDELRVSNVDRFSLKSTADTDMWTTGKFGNAVDLSSQNNDYVAFENYDTICQTSGSTTWEFWMKPDEVDTDIGWGTPVHAYGKVQFLYQQVPAGGIVQFMIFDWSKVPTDYYKSINGTTRLTPGEWTHVAGTWNDTDFTMKLYINGVLDASATFSDYYCWTYDFWSGSAREAPGTYNFSGLVDELHVSNIDRYSAYNDPAWTWTTGKFGNTVNLSGRDNDYLVIDDYDSLIAYNTNMTWEFWMKPDNIDTDIDRSYPINAPGSAEFRYQNKTNGGTVSFLVRDFSKVGTGKPYYSQITTPDTIPTGEWTHIAGVWNRDIKKQSLYINGVEKVSCDTWTKFYCAEYSIGVGAPIGSDLNFPGLIDEFRISNVDRFNTGTSPSTATTYITVTTTDSLEDSIMYAVDNTEITLSSGTHHIESMTPIAGVKNLTISGQDWDSTVVVVDSSVSKALKVMSGVHDLIIERMTICGEETNTANIHILEVAQSSVDVRNLTFRHLWIENVGVGISVNGKINSDIANITISDNVIYKTIGTEAGSGYGIHNNMGHNVLIANNWVEESTRHGIYQARGDTDVNVVIRNNFILNHQYYDAATHPYAGALTISRSSNVKAAFNVIVNSHTVGIGILGDEIYGWPVSDVVLLNNQVLGAHFHGFWSKEADTITMLGNVITLAPDSDGDMYNLNFIDTPTQWGGTTLVSPDDRWDTIVDFVAEMGDYVYIIEDGVLDKITPYTWSYTTDGSTTWSDVDAMTALEDAVGGNNRLYIVKDEELHEVDPENSFADNTDTETIWGGVRFMAAADGYVTIADTDTLWKVVPSTLEFPDSSTDWADINAMCDWDENVYIDYGDTYYEVNTNTLDDTVIGVVNP
jgi:concanavalin A-like lectin/glucanase superfamily protein